MSSAEPANFKDKQPYHHGDLRAALMAAALTLIERHGVKGFSLKDAARIAGVSVAAPYRHFADKEALLGAIQEESFVRFNAALAASGHDAATPRERLMELGVGYLRFAREHPARIRVMFGSVGERKLPTAEAAGPFEPTGYELLVEAVSALDPGASADDQQNLVLACWSVVHGYALLLLDGALTAMVAIPDPEMQLRRVLAELIAQR